MRKIDSKRILEKFHNALFDIVAVGVFAESGDVTSALEYESDSRKYPREKLMRLLSEQCAISAAVVWEVFIAELFVCLINRDCTKYSAGIRARFTISIKEKFGEELAKQAILKLGSHLTKNQIKHSLNPRAHNLTFKDSDEMIARASELLSDKYAKRFNSLSPAEKATINAWLAIRNYLTHKSPGARERLKKALSSTQLPRSLRWATRSRHDLGAYLFAGRKKMRLFDFLTALRVIANKIALK